jgi:hypothetical protein
MNGTLIVANSSFTKWSDCALVFASGTYATVKNCVFYQPTVDTGGAVGGSAWEMKLEDSCFYLIGQAITGSVRIVSVINCRFRMRRSGAFGPRVTLVSEPGPSNTFVVTTGCVASEVGLEAPAFCPWESFPARPTTHRTKGPWPTPAPSPEQTPEPTPEQSPEPTPEQSRDAPPKIIPEISTVIQPVGVVGQELPVERSGQFVGALAGGQDTVSGAGRQEA